MAFEANFSAQANRLQGRAKQLYGKDLLSSAKYNLMAERMWLQLYRRKPKKRFKNSALFVRHWALKAHWKHLRASSCSIQWKRHQRLVKTTFKRYGSLTFTPKSRRTEAIGILKSLYSATFETPHAEAVGARKWAEAKKQLSYGVKMLDEVLDLAPELKICQIISASQIHIVNARKNLAKTKARRDLRIVSQEYGAAARATDPERVKNSLLKEDQRENKYYHHLHSANCHRYRAFSWLAANEAPEPPLIRLTHASDCVDRALAELRNADRIRKSTYGARQAKLLRYWKHVLAARCSQLQASKTLETYQVEEAAQSIQHAINIATKWNRDEEAHFFPNRFYTVAHLKLESVWLEAFKALVECDFDRSANYLQQYVDNFPGEYEESWWHANAKVRLHAVRCLRFLEVDDLEGFDNEYRELRCLIGGQPCGAAAIKIESHVKAARITNQAAVDAGHQVMEMFPIDARGHDLSPPEDQERLEAHLQSLPGKIYDGLTAASYTPEGFSEAWKGLLALLVDYYELWKTSQTDFRGWLSKQREKDLRDLILRSQEVGLSKEAKESIQDFSDDPANTWDSEVRVSGLIALGKIAPLRVHLAASPRWEPDLNAYVWKAWPDWARRSSAIRGRHFGIEVRSENEDDLQGGVYWYLPPEWRKGTRRTLRKKFRERMKRARTELFDLETVEEIRKRRTECGFGFEDSVYKFLVGCIPIEYEAVRESNSAHEIDLQISFSRGRPELIGEMKFSHSGSLETTTAISQLGVRSCWFKGKYGFEPWQVLITNARELDQEGSNWAQEKEKHLVWFANLNVELETFLQTGQATVICIREAAVSGQNLVAGEQVSEQYFRQLAAE